MRDIDVLFEGVPRAISCFAIDDVIVDPGPESCAATLLDALAGERPRAILLTHIHLDHAGATGALLRAWPGTEVWVHERGAPHLIDPSRLIASATRIYGDEMERLWGQIVPVDADRVRVFTGGERARGFRVEYTPGHATHHVAYLHEASSTLFAGDVAGVRIGDGPLLVPTPPPDIDLEAWRASLDRIAALEPARVAVTHSGVHDDFAAHLDALRAGLDEFSALARGVDAATYEAAVRARIGDRPAYLSSMPPDTLYAGLRRYWDKRDTASR